MTEVFMGNSKQYTDEFRAEAERQVIERGFTVVDVASRIGIPKHTLYGWLLAIAVRCQAAEGNRRRGSCRTAWRIPLARTVPIACARSVRMQLQASVDRPATWRTLFRKANAMCP
ncbi:transposase [Xanthomonas translucens pv. secalis]|nr:transposase [Xanthomonas translucens pv. undulosa]QSQ58115.1 transposase [Xanthomonas translucens pv. undulosa]UKE38342.1 transposase [Xanthomonas translucens pv. undulosa]UKE42036.1 transposase [Xanthomonas translucens pv. secalis]